MTQAMTSFWLSVIALRLHNPQSVFLIVRKAFYGFGDVRTRSIFIMGFV